MNPIHPSAGDRNRCVDGAGIRIRIVHSAVEKKEEEMNGREGDNERMMTANNDNGTGRVNHDATEKKMTKRQRQKQKNSL